MDKWINRGSKLIGNEHIRRNLPCQDNYKFENSNGVNAIVLSDGCGSSKLSQYGSKLTVDVLSKLLCKNFDSLWLYDEKNLKERIIKEITTNLFNFVNENKKLILDFNLSNPYYKKNFEEIYEGSTLLEKLYPLTIFNATVQFVAVKGDRSIAGRIGDGLILKIANGEAKILSTEDKILGMAENETIYPVNILLDSEYIDNPYDSFEIIKETDLPNDLSYLITSDGISDVLLLKDDQVNTSKIDYMRLDEAYNNSLEEYLQFLNTFHDVQDDISIVTMQRGKFEYSNLVLREYNLNGSTIRNDLTTKKSEEIELDWGNYANYYNPYHELSKNYPPLDDNGNLDIKKLIKGSNLYKENIKVEPTNTIIEDEKNKEQSNLINDDKNTNLKNIKSIDLTNKLIDKVNKNFQQYSKIMLSKAELGQFQKQFIDDWFDLKDPRNERRSKLVSTAFELLNEMMLDNNYVNKTDFENAIMKKLDYIDEFDLNQLYVYLNNSNVYKILMLENKIMLINGVKLS